jgi:membrane peptidoglycan carboxypeptidase
VMKIFSIAAALDDGTVAPDTTFDLGGGQFVVGGSKAIRDVHSDPYLTVAGIIKRSSNVGAAKIALRFGADKLHAALRRFGFGARTGIELPGEQPGLLRDPARWRDRDLASIAFGYGLSVTPLQIAAATAAFGNRGIYVEPRIVDRVIDGDGTLLYQAQPTERRVVSERTAAAMLAMLASVFEGGKQNGTASTVVVPGFRCAGKTGTANRYDPTTHSYADRYLSSFAGLAPLDHPRLAIVAMVDEPSGSDHYGGTIAGPVFARVASEALRYLGVPGEPAVCAPAAPAPAGSPASEAPKTCVPPPPGAAQHAQRAEGAHATTPAAPAANPTAASSANHGSAVVATATSSAMPAGATVASPSSVPATAAGSAASAPAIAGQGAGPDAGGAAATEIVPDFRGMGIARAIAAARDAHLAVALSGTGRVVEQRPPPGPSGGETRVWLRLSDGRAAAP